MSKLLASFMISAIFVRTNVSPSQVTARCFALSGTIVSACTKDFKGYADETAWAITTGIIEAAKAFYVKPRIDFVIADSPTEAEEKYCQKSLHESPCVLDVIAPNSTKITYIPRDGEKLTLSSTTLQNYIEKLIQDAPESGELTIHFNSYLPEPVLYYKFETRVICADHKFIAWSHNGLITDISALDLSKEEIIYFVTVRGVPMKRQQILKMIKYYFVPSNNRGKLTPRSPEQITEFMALNSGE